MTSKKKVTITLLILTILYITFSFKPLRTELELTPSWTTEVTYQIQENDSSLDVLPFKLEQNVGYFSRTGQIVTLKNFDYKATISQKLFATYSQNSTGFEVFDSSGKIVGTITGGGFPYIVDDRIFLLLPGGSGFEIKDLSNSTLARYQGTSPITALNSNNEISIVGFADGTLCTFDKKFNLKNTLNPSGSDIDVILGANASLQANYFACISGQNKQRFVLYENKPNHAKIIFHKYLDNSIVNQTLIYFSNDESTVYYNDANGIGIVNCTDLKYKHINIPGKVLSIQESYVSNSVFVLSKEKMNNRNKYTVTILESKTNKTGSFNFEANSAFILTDQNSLFVGKDNKISKFEITKE